MDPSPASAMAASFPPSKRRKDSNYRYTPLSSHDLVDAFGRLDQVPDVVCTGGWWSREARPTGSPSHVGYRGVARDEITVDRR